LFQILGFPLTCPGIFSTSTTTGAELDYEGEELPDKQAAWHEATVMAGQTLQSLDGKLQPNKEWRMEVTDEFANPLYVLHICAEKPK
jgi:hypothetical protein